MAESLHILFGTSACLQWLCHSGEQTVAPRASCFFWGFFAQKKLAKPHYMYSTYISESILLKKTYFFCWFNLILFTSVWK